MGGITLCNCLIHAKWKFHEARKVNPDNGDAKTGENYIQKLFAIESRVDKIGCPAEKRLALRQKASKEVLDEFYGWIGQAAQRTLPQSLVGKAIICTHNQKEYLSSFLKDGRIQLSNNLTEQSVNPFVIVRKSWLLPIPRTERGHLP